MSNRVRNRKKELKFKKYLRDVDLSDSSFKPKPKPWK